MNNDAVIVIVQSFLAFFLRMFLNVGIGYGSVIFFRRITKL